MYDPVLHTQTPKNQPSSFLQQNSLTHQTSCIQITHLEECVVVVTIWGRAHACKIMVQNTYISRTQNPTAFVLQQIVCQECRSQFLCSSSRRNKSFRVENSLRDQKQLYCMHAYMACDFWFYKGRKKVHSITWANVSWALGSQWRWCWLLPHYHHHCDCLCCDPGAS